MPMVKVPKKTDEAMSIGYEPSEPRYPWGTSLDLETEMVETLGIADLEVGQEVQIVGTVVVASKRQNTTQQQGGEAKSAISIELQFTEMQVAKPTKSTLDILYGGD